MSKDKFTPTQQRIVDLLSDGKPHTRKELHGCLWDELASRSMIKYHLCHIRKVLRPRGEDILCLYLNRTYQYQHVKLIKPKTRRRPSVSNP